MIRCCLCVFLCLTGLAAVHGTTSDDLARPRSPIFPQVVESVAEQQVLAAEAGRTAAKRSGDASQFSGWLSTDFIEISRFGRLLGRRQASALARNPNYETEDVQVRIYGNGAVVTGRESDEGEVPGAVRFLRVWIQAGTGWLELADEGTDIISEAEAARLSHAQAPRKNRTAAEPTGADANHVAEAAEAPAAVARDVLAAETAYSRAEQLNDLTSLGHLRAPEFRLVDGFGNVVPEPARVRAAVKPAQGDFGVRVHGNLAVTIGNAAPVSTSGLASDRFRYSVVWANRDGRWQAVAEQRTPIS
jgi:hypothetical protein